VDFLLEVSSITVVFFSKKVYPHSSVLVGSRNRSEGNLISRVGFITIKLK